MDKKIIAVITARGGSKRIPKKNIKDFCGKPIIAYSIQAALDAGIFDEVMVSTDSEEIADIAKQYGASVPFLRSAETANDFATTSDVLMEVIHEYEKIGKVFDILVCIYPTAPFITAQKIKSAVELLDEKTDKIIPVVQYSFPPQRALINRNGRLLHQYPENEYVRSQDLEPIYHDCGQFYVMKPEAIPLPTSQAFIRPFILPETEVQDIDNPEDWEIAEMKYQIMKKRQKDTL